MEQKPIRIFLVDDDADDCELFKEALNECPVPVILETLCNGEDLLSELSSIDGQVPDVIFLDINMPKKNGHEVLGEIRNSEKFKYVPVVMFSTSTYKEDIDYSYEHGANLYIPKGLFFSEQKNVIRTLFTDEWDKYLTKIPREKFVLRKDMLE
jgi:CheY-like chemotaxis protein